MGREGAGKRAWETRRANQQAAKRSEAANKAWATRRAKAAPNVVEKVLTAAQKAWETRRANGWVNPAKRPA